MLNDNNRQELIAKIEKYRDAGYDQSKLLEIEKEIIWFEDPELSLYFAGNIKNSDIAVHKSIVCQSKNANLMWEFMQKVYLCGEYRNELAAHIIDTNDEHFIALLCEDDQISSIIRENAIKWLLNNGHKFHIYDYLIGNGEYINSNGDYIDNDRICTKMIKKIYQDLTDAEKEHLRYLYPLTMQAIEKTIEENEAFNDIQKLVKAIKPIES